MEPSLDPFVDFPDHKKKGFTTRERRSFPIRENGRSTDFVAPGLATGCELACSYCYVARHRAYGNPLEVYTNKERIWKEVYNHFITLPDKTPNQCDPIYWTYDIGESSDCMSPKNIDNTNWYINSFLTHTKAKPSFATKLAVSSKLNPISSLRQARIRVSVALQSIIDLTEKATSTLSKRVESINKLYELGYEVHLNFSPVIAYKGWTKDYIQLFDYIDKNISDEVKQQLKCEVIFLTHNKELHDTNMRWIPESDLLWTPQWQEYKTTLRGDNSVVRYNSTIKPKLVTMFKDILSSSLPYCKIRYIF